MVIAIGCAGAASPFDYAGPDFLEFYVVLFALVMAASFGLRHLLRLPATGPAPDTLRLSAESTAYLAGGTSLAAQASLLGLVQRSAVQLDALTRQAILLDADARADGSAGEAMLLGLKVRSRMRIDQLLAVGRSAAREAEEGLRAQGLLAPYDRSTSLVVIPLAVSLVAPAIGVIKIWLGLSRDRPVGFLVALCILSVIISLVAFARGPWRSRYGDNVLRDLRFGGRRLRSAVGGVGAQPDDVVMSVALFGLAAVASGPLFADARLLRPASSTFTSSGCSGGSSCGSQGSCSAGGGCGGGSSCGGGGGCGGCSSG